MTSAPATPDRLIPYPSRFALGLALTAAAGSVNGISFLRLGSVYASFMSGNTVQLGLHTAAADWPALGYFGVLVALFMLGGVVGGILVGQTGRWHLAAILALEALSIGLALWLDLRLGLPLASTAPLAFAMGAQNHLVVLARGANPATTFVTGTAFRFGDALAQWLMGRDPYLAWRLHLVVWLAFAVGAAMGASAHHLLDGLALAPVAALMGALAVGAIVATARPPAAQP